MDSCSLCHDSVGGEDDWWTCEECEGGFALCLACNEEESSHAHRLKLNRGKPNDRYLFSIVDPLTSSKLFLGNYACALPNSQTIRDNEIRFVVTLMCFGGDVGDDVVELEQLYDGGEKRTVVRDGVTYHLIQMPDVTTPARLAASEAQVLEEATCFIDAALHKGGNVLVHCHKGEKRSPTILLAWMGTRNFRLMDSIERIDHEYRGKPGWGNVYKRTRKDWIEELKNWNRNWAERQKEWSEKVVVVQKKSK